MAPKNAIGRIFLGLATGGLSEAVRPIFKKPKVPEIKPVKSPLAGESTELKPGQKVSGVLTSPQGLLSDAPTARNSLLGG